MVVGDSENITIAHDEVGCLQQNGNVDDVDLHRAPIGIIKINWPFMCRACAGVYIEGVRTLLSS